MEPVTEPAAWLRHERAHRCAQLMIPLLVRSGDLEHARMWMAWLLGLHHARPLDRC